MDNPYAPPSADLTESVGFSADALPQYAGFWRRFGAFWLDGLILLPLNAIVFLLSHHFRLFGIYALIPMLLIGIGFNCYLVVTYGGTPGKLLLGAKIAMCDGSAVTLRAAALRYAVLFLVSVLSRIAIIIAALHMTDQEYSSLGYMAQNQTLMSFAPGWYKPVAYLSQIWVWSEFLVMMFNKKRRGLQDFMAGTVVIRYKVNKPPSKKVVLP